jgi:hypothetical protein
MKKRVARTSHHDLDFGLAVLVLGVHETFEKQVDVAHHRQCEHRSGGCVIAELRGPGMNDKCEICCD